eukprot:PLAT334.1.p1 GENE.PLAT334.1~~PLAT334.1.p1  ORF type:complete len:135 (-),score=26.58 PLAT334.1:68-448(-)
MVGFAAAVLLLVAAQAYSPKWKEGGVLNMQKLADTAPKKEPAPYSFGLPSFYRCYGRVFDEPRRMRMTCEKQPRRRMNCGCDERVYNSQMIRCSCPKPDQDVLLPEKPKPPSIMPPPPPPNPLSKD